VIALFCGLFFRRRQGGQFNALISSVFLIFGVRLNYQHRDVPLVRFPADTRKPARQIAANETYTVAQSASVSKISTTPQPLRLLRFQKRTFTAQIITQFGISQLAIITVVVSIAATLRSKMSDVLCSTLAFSLEKLEYEN
jgi:hypothetical protein